MNQKEKFLILDTNSILHRTYHALPKLTTKEGEPIQAVYGFLLIFFKALKEIQPHFICACFDFPAKTFRHEKLKEYKATRPPTPLDLTKQINLLKEILKAFNVAIFEKKGFEADDLIGTIAYMVSQKELIETVILSGDMDVLQLVNNNTKVFLLQKGISKTVCYNESLVKERYNGLTPVQLVDFKALKGDPSDNIKGLPGIGEKTAIELLKKYGNIEGIYQKIEELKPRIKNLFFQYKDKVFLYKNLVEIKKNIPLELDLNECRFGRFQKEDIVELFKKLEFYSLIEKIPPPTKKENLRLL